MAHPARAMDPFTLRTVRKQEHKVSMILSVLELECGTLRELVDMRRLSFKGTRTIRIVRVLILPSRLPDRNYWLTSRDLGALASGQRIHIRTLIRRISPLFHGHLLRKSRYPGWQACCWRIVQ